MDLSLYRAQIGQLECLSGRGQAQRESECGDECGSGAHGKLFLGLVVILGEVVKIGRSRNSNTDVLEVELSVLARWPGDLAQIPTILEGLCHGFRLVLCVPVEAL